jgi:predicted ATPase
MLNRLILRSISCIIDSQKQNSGFPFNLPIFKKRGVLELNSPITFLVGENGSGKSTFMEALACKIGCIVVGSDSLQRDNTLNEVRKLSECLHLSWTKKTKNGFFLRAEDFFGYTKKLSLLKAQIKEDINTVDEEYSGRSEYAKGLAKMPHLNELNALENSYERGLESYSHGESFLELFQSRIKPNGLYLLDEPEAPLSPFRQLGFLSLLKKMISEGSQFIIATHSPILMAFPNAEIFNFDTLPIQKVKYNELEHVILTKSFLQNPAAYLNKL